MSRTQGKYRMMLESAVFVKLTPSTSILQYCSIEALHFILYSNEGFSSSKRIQAERDDFTRYDTLKYGHLTDMNN